MAPRNRDPDDDSDVSTDGRDERPRDPLTPSPDLRGERSTTAQGLTPEQLALRLQALQERVEGALAERPPRSCAATATLDELIAQLEASTDALLQEHQRELDKAARVHHQFGELLEVVMGLAALDYSQRATVYEGQDDATNALAIGLNMMCEELEHATTALIHTRDEALAANRAQTTFLANMSHEFRTPLNAIIGYSELLYEEQSATASPTMITDLERINTAARHLLDLIQDTLDISKIEAEKLDLEMRPIDLRELLDEIIATIEPTIALHTNHFEYVPDFNLTTIVGDSTRLRQVLLNLLSNASKFTHDGVVTLTVREGHDEGRHMIEFAVSDTGIGIESTMLDTIFEAFSQADDSTTRIYGGTGLGLTISRRLCEMMGGKLSVTSEVGVGSTFIASLPTDLPPTS